MKKLLFLCCLTAVTGCYGQNTQDDEFEPELLPSRAAEKIKEITITGVAKTSPAGGEGYPDCGSFVLSISEAREFLNKAAEISRSDNHYRMNWSPCYVEGTLVLKNGKKGVWDISQFRGGSIVLDGKDTIYLYCPKCKSKAFLPEL